MRNILLGFLLVFSSQVNAEIKTKEQADKFIGDYCVSLVNEIQKAVIRQGDLAKEEKWDEFMKTGTWISGVADVYSKLCK